MRHQGVSVGKGPAKLCWPKGQIPGKMFIVLVLLIWTPSSPPLILIPLWQLLSSFRVLSHGNPIRAIMGLGFRDPGTQAGSPQGKTL